LPTLQGWKYSSAHFCLDQLSRLTIQSIGLVGKLIKTNYPITSQQR
jgi:hypothetical protein